MRELVLEKGSLEVHIQRNEDDAHLRAGEVEVDHWSRGFRDEREASRLPYAEPHQARGHPIGVLVDLSPRTPPIIDVHELFVSALSYSLREGSHPGSGQIIGIPGAQHSLGTWRSGIADHRVHLRLFHCPSALVSSN